MNFEEALSDLIDKHLTREGYEGIISALELKLMAMKEPKLLGRPSRWPKYRTQS